VAEFFRNLLRKKEEPEKPKLVDMATTAPLTDQQLNSEYKI
jgi:hypothetical protein